VCDAQVLDRAVVARVAQWVAKRRPGLLSQSTLWRLTAPQHGSAIGPETLTTLEAVLIEEGEWELFEKLDAALLPPGGVARRRAYERWAKAQLHRFLHRDGSRDDSVAATEWIGRLGALSVGESLELSEGTLLGLELGELRGQSLRRWRSFCALIHRVRASEAGPRLRAFRADFQDLGGRRDPDSLRSPSEGLDRFVVALLNILGPLLESPETDFVERQWEDLDDAELCAFVKAGIDRERILLKRPPLRNRLRAVPLEMKLERATVRTFDDDPGWDRT
jgi:hypothetical protein